MWGWAGMAPWGREMASKPLRKPPFPGQQQKPGVITSPRRLQNPPRAMSQHLPLSQAANAPPSSCAAHPRQLSSVMRHKIQKIIWSLYCKEALSKLSLGRAARRCSPGHEQGCIHSSAALQTYRRKLTSTYNITPLQGVRKIPLGMKLLGVPRGIAQPGMNNAAFPSGPSNGVRSLCCFCC